ncbi:glutamine synthetase beta-grasp domain-containing protein [Candidatus Uhrbacteria bacterium]|nr:glutamine synthetase beta-grasp domain-containing protein [Candidatus Uhrbacteria bacterium]
MHTVSNPREVYRAEYIWIDGGRPDLGDPTQKLRSKTKVVPLGEEPPVWGFDGSSTFQAPGNLSDCVLKPVFSCHDPIRGGKDRLVLCEVLNVDMTPHASNTRAANAMAAATYAHHDSWFGIEQEYTLFKGAKPLGWPENGFPAPQGGYYCGVGADEVFGAEIIEEHTAACLAAGLTIAGTNAEVMPGQWEFQVGTLGPTEVSDQLWMSRWLLYRIAAKYGVYATLAPKPVKGDWNGAGAHTNFSTKGMREMYEPILAAVEALKARHHEHVAVYGFGIEQRLTGRHETSRYDEFRWGVSDRGASIRIPWQVARDKKGYLEDRRPNANMDPYQVTRMIVETVCAALDAKMIGQATQPTLVANPFLTASH